MSDKLQLAGPGYEVPTPTAFSPTMSSAAQAAMFNELVLKNDLSKLSEEQRVEYYRLMCERSGLDPVNKPFEMIVLNGKLTMYATKRASDGLTALKKLRVTIVSRQDESDLHVVLARAEHPNGACSEDIGAVTITGLRTEALANAKMKAITKAKRRAILSVCGLGMLDETEIETLPVGTAQPVELPAQLTQEIKVSKLTDEEAAALDMWRDTLEAAEDAETLTGIALQLKNASQAMKDAVGPIVKQRADALRLIWKGGKYVELI